MSSESRCFVTQIPEPIPHPNADALDIIRVHGNPDGTGGYPCIVKRGSFRAGDLAVYIPVDSLVPANMADIAFLAPTAKVYSQIPGAGDQPRCRIQAKRLRGVFSMGLLIPATDAQEGADVTDALGIVKYESPELTEGTEKDPGFLPVYDVEGVRRWSGTLREDEEVVIEEKIDGQNARFVYRDGRLWCASRTKYWLPSGNNAWAQAARRYNLEQRLAQYPGVALYGEVTADGALTVFDVHWHTGEFLGFVARTVFLRQLAQLPGIPGAPIEAPALLYQGPWLGLGVHAALAEGPTLRIGGKGIREGWVVRPVRERTVPDLGRVILKLHGEGWLLKKQ